MPMTTNRPDAGEREVMPAKPARCIILKEEVSMPKHRVEVIDRNYAAILAAKTPAERVAIMDSMHRTARLFVESRVREVRSSPSNPSNRFWRHEIRCRRSEPKAFHRAGTQ